MRTADGRCGTSRQAEPRPVLGAPDKAFSRPGPTSSAPAGVVGQWPAMFGNTHLRDCWRLAAGNPGFARGGARPGACAVRIHCRGGRRSETLYATNTLPVGHHARDANVSRRHRRRRLCDLANLVPARAANGTMPALINNKTSLCVDDSSQCGLLCAVLVVTPRVSATLRAETPRVVLPRNAPRRGLW